jgi:tellurite methyltransferase
VNKQEMNDLYAGEAYIWGKEPSRFAKELLAWIPDGTRTILEFGSGEGRDCVFLAEQGFTVTGLEASSAGTLKAERLARIRTLPRLPAFLIGDINTFEIQQPVDVLYSIGALQYIRPELREQRFCYWKQMTGTGGIHFLFAFFVRPDAPLSPDWGSEEYPYERDELQRYYLDWEILHSYEYRFPCDSGGVPHVHAARVLVARNSNRDEC